MAGIWIDTNWYDGDDDGSSVVDIDECNGRVYSKAETIAAIERLKALCETETGATQTLLAELRSKLELSLECFDA